MIDWDDISERYISNSANISRHLYKMIKPLFSTYYHDWTRETIYCRDISAIIKDIKKSTIYQRIVNMKLIFFLFIYAIFLYLWSIQVFFFVRFSINDSYYILIIIWRQEDMSCQPPRFHGGLACCWQGTTRSCLPAALGPAKPQLASANHSATVGTPTSSLSPYQAPVITKTRVFSFLR